MIYSEQLLEKFISETKLIPVIVADNIAFDLSLGFEGATRQCVRDHLRSHEFRAQVHEHTVDSYFEADGELRRTIFGVRDPRPAYGAFVSALAISELDAEFPAL